MATKSDLPCSPGLLGTPGSDPRICNGSVHVPETLRPFMGGREHITRQRVADQTLIDKIRSLPPAKLGELREPDRTALRQALVVILGLNF